MTIEIKNCEIKGIQGLTKKIITCHLPKMSRTVQVEVFVKPFGMGQVSIDENWPVATRTYCYILINDYLKSEIHLDELKEELKCWVPDWHANRIAALANRPLNMAHPMLYEMATGTWCAGF